ncbi:MAG: hypothetical protein KUG74_02760 [Rhodobacteraceae bacterium]|nr:hypothetical protein [Paracoccaceae bacterium]
MGEIRAFSITLWVALLACYLISGGRLLDWVFGMPDIAQFDDWLIAAVDWADQLKIRLGFGDWFGALRQWLHSILGV